MDKTDLDALDILCMTLAANENEIEGRTTIQKLTYFEMQKIKGLNVNPHKAYRYGPFNTEISDGLGTLVYINVISEKRLPGTYPTWGYKIEEKGIPVVEKLKVENEKIYNKIENIVKTCKEYCSLKQTTLAITAKVHYIRSHKKTKKMTPDEIISMSKNFGWEIKKKDIKDADALLGKLGLVRV